MKILFIDDNPRQIKDYIEILKFENFVCESCINKNEFEKLLKKTKYDLIIIDIILEQNPQGLRLGFDIVNLCKKNNLKYLILTSLKEDSLKKEMKNLYGNIFFKGFFEKSETSPTDLLEVIKGKIN